MIVLGVYTLNIDSNGNPLGPLRVWVKNEDFPGLAMTRSYGDQIAASVGVSSIPGILTLDTTIKNKAIIMGSDGIWDFISPESVKI